MRAQWLSAPWAVEKGGLELEPFESLARTGLRELREEAGRLEAFLAG